ncbi:cytochrome c oxidase assembly factor 6 homolog isoform X1 [Globicephala melas]|uniref:cytochrome c oxidase assembly factor 6 homolog isoform X1 n=1 Tax=Globicephala melas TaxID=9731 RepID=UPI00293D517A|nr:cytochrome c oxidase assembly factor 6 homolog isoform X3 [Globicephala melas]
MAAPSMKERQACWGARDEYWKCLDENTEDASRCKKLRSSFESSCPQQWEGKSLHKFLFCFWLCRAACGISVPRPGIAHCSGSAES